MPMIDAPAALVTNAHHVTMIGPAGLQEWVQRFVHSFCDHLVSDSFTVLVLTVAARVGWGLAYWSWRLLRFYLSPAVAQFPVDLGKLEQFADQPNVDFNGVKVFCQIVRFGADSYIQKLASEQEKFEGRLQNRVLPVAMIADEHGYRGRLLLPVHRRLGTQFKMFIVAPSSSHARSLCTTGFFTEPERHAKRRGRRISFTLKDVDKMENIEKSTFNNIVYPSNLHDFVERNSFGPLYLGLQGVRWRYTQWRRRQGNQNGPP